jgi:hypothetical protein
MHTLAKSVLVGLTILTCVASTSHAQYYRHYYSPNSTYLWPYNYPRYQTSFSVTPYYYPGYMGISITTRLIVTTQDHPI